MPATRTTTTAEDVEVTAKADEVERKTVRRSGLGGSVQGLIDKIEDERGDAQGEKAYFLDSAKRSLLAALRDLDWADGRDAHGQPDEDQKRRLMPRDEQERQALRDEIESQGGPGALEAAEKDDAEKAEQSKRQAEKVEDEKAERAKRT